MTDSPAAHVTDDFRPGLWLRRLGVIAVLSAGALFLVEGAGGASTLERELGWAGLTLALALLGILAARVGRDAAGARALLGLAAATIPPHFAEVGGRLWDQQHAGTDWQSGLWVSGLVLLGLAIPLSFGVSALVRGRGVQWTLLLFGLSAPLLLMTRHGDVVALVVMAELFFILALELASFRRDPRMRTPEGMAARAMLLLPPSILLVRSAFYTPTFGWEGALFAAPSLVVMALPHVTRVPVAIAVALQCLAVGGLATGCLIAFHAETWLALALSVIGLIGSRVTVGQPRLLEQLGVVVFLIGSVVAWFVPGVGYAACLFPVAALHVLAAHRSRSLVSLVVVGVATLVGGAAQVAFEVRLPLHDAWIVVAIAGLAILAAATVAERFRGVIQARWSGLVAHYDQTPVRAEAAATKDVVSPESEAVLPALGGPFRSAAPPAQQTFE